MNSWIICWKIRMDYYVRRRLCLLEFQNLFFIIMCVQGIWSEWHMEYICPKMPR